jgi:hypothetical protein
MSDTKHTKRTTVITIVADYLRANGFGGLVADGAECGCDLAPCCSEISHCRPGYKHLTPSPDAESDWVISTNKDWKQSHDD